MRLAEAVGIDPMSVDYVTHDGGGDLLAALFSDEVSVSTSSPGEFLAQIDAGQLRVLAVSSDEPVPGIDAPTLRASGIGLTFANWRGVLAPPGISASSRESMIRLLTELHDSGRWQEALRDNGWTDSFVTGAEFERFLDEQDDRVSTTLTRLGLI
jgi:putative tricarboxylic transport membrane protein